MEPKIFELTTRKEDILEIYKGQVKFKLFTREHLAQLLFISMFFLFSVYSLIAWKNDAEFGILAIIFLFGLGYQLIELIKKYLKKQKAAETLNTWINAILKHQSHKVEVAKGALIYFRDKELYVYEFSKVKELRIESDYFYMSIQDDRDIILPRKAFKPNEFDLFLQAIEEMKQRN